MIGLNNRWRRNMGKNIREIPVAKRKNRDVESQNSDN